MALWTTGNSPELTMPPPWRPALRAIVLCSMVAMPEIRKAPYLMRIGIFSDSTAGDAQGPLFEIAAAPLSATLLSMRVRRPMLSIPPYE